MHTKLLLTGLFIFFGFCVFAQQLPEKSSTLVTDYTNTLSTAARQQLEKKLVAFNDSTSIQIAVVIIKTTGNADIGDYGLKLGRTWGIGQKNSNNGVLILVAMADHKVTIKTGFGVEDELPDSVAHRIINTDILSNFKKQDYYEGLDAATDDIIIAFNGKNLRGNLPPNPSSNRKGLVTLAIILVFIILVLVIGIGARRSGGQIISSRGSASPFWWFLGGTMIGRASGGWDGFSDSNGGLADGDNNGGDDNQDNNSGGDFGGFDGGDFGGGGSDGSW